MTETMIKTTLRVNSALWKSVRVRALDEQQSTQALIITALKDYLKKRAKPTRRGR